ncbi:ABC transporter permease [uncultured Tenacibaculum sp.]|uniref:ABC transporter permease n=1 Tax=uncultured Tenacibaculum sp. TaxID=174713 RepID=UPI002614FBFE|nr:ABC transporter permease [uncultured Tenacibaculum sp.]
MNIWKITLQNIKSKPLYTFLSVFTLALSVGLLLGIQQLKSSFKHQIEKNLAGIDLVVGAKGSPLQLVLASVLHLDNPTGNISYKDAKKIGKNPLIKTAVPISYGDNYKGYRIVGTTDDFLKLYKAELEKGTTTKKSLEVVIGATIAEKLKLSIGDTFLSSHGLIENEIDVHNEVFTVVGILKPTYQAIDRLIITKLESIWDAHDHHDHEEGEHDEHKGHEIDDQHNEHDHEEHHETDLEDHEHESSQEDKQVTSLLISFKNPVALLTMPRKINESTNMQAALPKYELDKLYSYTGIGFKTINWIAYLILIISGMIIFISLYKMVKERAFDLALLRTFGASNFQLIKMMVYEGLLIVLTAFISGLLLIKILLKFIFVFAESGYQQGILKALSFNDIFSIGIVIVSFVFVAIALAIYPIVTMNVSKILSNEK